MSRSKMNRLVLPAIFAAAFASGHGHDQIIDADLVAFGATDQGRVLTFDARSSLSRKVEVRKPQDPKATFRSHDNFPRSHRGIHIRAWDVPS